MWWKKSLLAKLLAGMLVCAVIPLSVSVAISYRTSSESVREQLIELNQQAMDSSLHYVKRYLEDLNRISVSLYLDPVLMGYLRTREPIGFNERLYISNLVYTISKERPEFRAVRFVRASSGESFTQSAFLRLSESDGLAAASTAESDPAGWTETHGYETVAANGETLLAFHKPIIDYPRTTVLGVLSIFVGPDEFQELIHPISGKAAPQDEELYLFIRGDNKLLYATSRHAAGESLAGAAGSQGRELYGSFPIEQGGQAGVMVYVKDSYKDIPLSLYKFIPGSVVNQAANQALQQSLAIPLIMAALVLVGSFLLSYILITPIKRLVRSIAKVQAGNFDMQPIPDRKDELGVLEHRFQAMVKGLDTLMNREYRYRLELATARLKMLQAQINPHFLYNSLQFIGTLALRYRAVEVSDKIAELGAIMRYSMDISAETVPLQREIEHIEHYMSLQTGRFKHKLNYTLSCPPEALPIQVPKMMLQPLVENSIVHGIEKGSGSGTIHIGIELSEWLVIRVMDNGKGMAPSAMEQIRLHYNGRGLASEQEQSIGLGNVLGRLRLMYEEGFQWEMDSVPYEATVITLRIRWNRQPGSGEPPMDEEAGQA